MSSWRIQFSGEITVTPPEPGGVIIFITEKDVHMGEIVVVDSETTLRATISLTDSEGHATKSDDVPVWKVGDDSVLTVTPSQDGMSATFTVGAPGVSSVTVTTQETHGGQGDPTPVVLSGVVTVTAGDTVTGSVDFAVG